MNGQSGGAGGSQTWIIFMKTCIFWPKLQFSSPKNSFFGVTSSKFKRFSATFLKIELSRDFYTKMCIISCFLCIKAVKRVKYRNSGWPKVTKKCKCA